MSIRLRQGGQSFSLAPQNECPAPSTLLVEVDTSFSAAYPSDTALTPREVLAAEGVECPDGFRIVVGTLPETAVSVAAVVSDRAVTEVNAEAARLGVEAVYKPLLLCAVEKATDNGKRSGRLGITATEENLYIAFARGGELLFCDAFRSVSPDDALYTVATIVKDFDLRDTDIIIGGEESKSVARRLKHYYRHVKCE